MKIKIINEERMINLGYILKDFYYPNLVITLTGDLGAGKTTFTKGIGKALGIKRVINSPTFTIMKEYTETNKLNGIEALYHLDVYRLNETGADFVLEEYFYQNGLSVIEWANNTKDLIPSSHWSMNINIDNDNKRIMELNIYDDITDIKKIEILLKGEGYEIIS